VLNLGAMIESAYPDIQVVYTRKTDVFIELHERANIANHAKADLFISIHCNWNPNTSPYGTETYVLGLHRAKDNLEVAKRENSSIFLENNYEKNYAGFDPNSPEGNILMTMSQNAHLTQSISIAEKIEKEFEHKSNRKSRGVRQAGFLVLRATSMPAVLIETGFLSNTKEEDYMTSAKGKKKSLKIFSEDLKNLKQM
jgi:N-acetylmuramoyl-L-alanine amidase